MKNEKLYLAHIIEAAARIRQYTAPGKKEFLQNTMMQDAVVKVLGNLTESATHIEDATKTAYPQIPWPVIKAFRNVLIHDYLGDLELEEVWKIVHDDLPELVEAIKRILKEKYGTEL